MIRLYPVQYQIPGAQMILFRDGHRTALTGQVLLRRLKSSLYFRLERFPFSSNAEIPSERYRLIQLSMVE